MRKIHLPEKVHKEKPQQKDIKRSEDLIERLEEAARIIDADMKKFQRSKRLSGADKTSRDLLINLVWEMGIYKNEEIGSFFGVSYSAVSKSVSDIRQRMAKDKKIKLEFEKLNSQFKM